MKSIIILFFCLFLSSLSCTKKSEPVAQGPNSTANTEASKTAILEQIKSGQNVETPKHEMSPEGISWLHIEFAKFYAGVFYEHGYKGEFRKEVLLDRKHALRTYIESIKDLARNRFDKWPQEHKLPFLINIYHAYLIELMVKKNFNKLNAKSLSEKDSVELFGQKMSLKDLIEKEIFPLSKNPDIVFSLKCFSKNCPEFRNSNLNYKNFDGMLKVSAARYFKNPDMPFYNEKTKKLNLPSEFSIFASLFPSKANEIRDFMFRFIEKEKQTKYQSLVGISFESL